MKISKTNPARPLIWLLLSLFSLSMLLSACSEEVKPKVISADELQALKKAHADSVMLVTDSLFKVNIYVPPLYDQQTFDPAAANKFFELAKGTKGDLKLLINSALITREIVNIIKEHATDGADLLFLIDKTGSMEDDIMNVKKGLSQVIDAIEDHKNVRLAIALYGDKNVDAADWFSFRNFEQDYSKAKQFIKGISVTSGGDTPESVYEGFFKCQEQDFWRSGNKRMIILIGDAPPLEKPLCSYTLQDVIKKATEDKVMMNFYPVVVTPTVEMYGTTGPTPPTYENGKLITAVYPNPCHGELTLVLERESEYELQVFNSAGTQVLTEKYSGAQWKKDLSELGNGVYVMRVIDKDKKFETTKFIIQK